MCTIGPYSLLTLRYMNEEFDLWSSVYSKNRYHVVINKKYSMYVGNMLIGWTNCFESCIPISSPMRDGQRAFLEF